ncbi:hypothetical protein DY000_02017413 [Brassica cretica]|uniref:Uncharacterized protein n=1 Tax=Brassica cretica TaxID=69181 RepID=A0ABQ7CTA2_BRACR|nr:hypothetical protein DY000_02017413 [Brassica cretica]
MDAGRLLSGRRPRAIASCCLSRMVASGRGFELSWMQAELRTLDTNRERLGNELDRRS